MAENFVCDAEPESKDHTKNISLHYSWAQIIQEVIAVSLLQHKYTASLAYVLH